jgi:hypothetical protein
VIVVPAYCLLIAPALYPEDFEALLEDGDAPQALIAPIISTPPSANAIDLPFNLVHPQAYMFA